jgi:hypothetical protein
MESPLLRVLGMLNLLTREDADINISQFTHVSSTASHRSGRTACPMAAAIPQRAPPDLSAPSRLPI